MTLGSGHTVGEQFRTGEDMGRRWISIILLMLAIAPVCFPGLGAAQQMRSGGKRKIVTQVKPVYPELARKMNMTGTVRLMVTVAAGGNVVRSEELGGSPVLVQAALDAIAKAKWEPSAQESKELVEIKFQPDAE
jgi:protein TonB